MAAPAVKRKAGVVLCGVCEYPVRDLSVDFGPDGDHSPCQAVLDAMEAEFQRRRRGDVLPVWSVEW